MSVRVRVIGASLAGAMVCGLVVAAPAGAQPRPDRAGGWADRVAAPTEQQLTQAPSSAGVRVQSTLRRVTDREWVTVNSADGWAVQARGGGVHTFAVTWSGLEGKKVVAWVRANGAECAAGQWQRHEWRNQPDQKNTKTLKYTFQEGTFGYDGGLAVRVENRHGQYATDPGGRVLELGTLTLE